MKTNGKFLTASLIALALSAVPSASAAIYTLPDIVRTANGGTVTENIDFASWSGSPPAAFSNDVLYLVTTVSWASTSNLGSFFARSYVFEGGGAARSGVAYTGSGFFVNGGQEGVALNRPAVQPVDTTNVTSMTLVLKIEQAKPSPGTDTWFPDVNDQDAAGMFMWIDPNLGTTEANNPTNLAYWRSGHATIRGVAFNTTNSDVDVTFSNIQLFSGGDTPFIPEPSTALLGGLGLLALLRRRRTA